MSEYQVITCRLCDTPIEVSPSLRGKVECSGKSGLLVEIGSSAGGWGHRRNDCSFTSEICTTCFKRAMTLAAPLIDFLRPPPVDASKPSTRQRLFQRKST